MRAMFIAISSLFLLPCSLFPQGPLPPPGPPAPTMKTLDQVEARTPLAGGTTPISIGSGSYYLTGNLTISSSVNGITITAGYVTIDLNGFALVGPGSGSGSGVYLNGGVSNVTILNGTIRNWGSHGINGLGNPSLRAEKLQVISNGGNGIAADAKCAVINCGAESNVGTGILGADNSLIKDCRITGTSGSPGDGVAAGQSSVVSGCVSQNNSGKGIVGSTVKDCAANDNGALGISAVAAESCTALGNGGYGFIVTIAGNCYGTSSDTSTGATGLYASQNASNCYGYSINGIGLYATNVSNCRGESGSGTGLNCGIVATGSSGYSNSGTGMIAFIANGCHGGTASGTAESITHKYNMP
jgi:hypothetical protein